MIQLLLQTLVLGEEEQATWLKLWAEDGVSFLVSITSYLAYREQYTEVGPLLRDIFVLYEQTQELSHQKRIQMLMALATVSYKRGQYTEAEPLFQRVLDLYEHVEKPFILLLLFV